MQCASGHGDIVGARAKPSTVPPTVLHVGDTRQKTQGQRDSLELVFSQPWHTEALQVSLAQRCLCILVRWKSVPQRDLEEGQFRSMLCMIVCACYFKCVHGACSSSELSNPPPCCDRCRAVAATCMGQQLAYARRNTVEWGSVRGALGLTHSPWQGWLAMEQRQRPWEWLLGQIHELRHT